MANNPEYCIYNTRKFRVDLKDALKKLAIDYGMTLEELINLALAEWLGGRGQKGGRDV
jgi:hypothetical protein